MMLTNLADVLRAAGLRVEELPGWKTRGHGTMDKVESITCHHTAGPKTGNSPSLATVRDGRPGLDGPLAQLFLARDGTWTVVAAGLCWHAGVVLDTYQSNTHAIGIEAEATGVDPWPLAQYDSYVRGARALADAFDVPVHHVLGHKEVAKPLGRKSDPNFDMDNFRAAVARSKGDAEMTEAQAAEMLKLLAAINLTLSGMNARIGVLANNMAPNVDRIADKYVGPN